MTIVRFLGEVIRDWKVLGLSFAIAGLRRRLTRRVISFRLDGRTVWVRGGESDFHTLRQTLRDREYAVTPDLFTRQIAARYEAILAQGRTPVIVDAGANIGGASLWFADLFPRAAVLAIEPDPANLAILRRNVAACPNIAVIDAAIGAEAGFVALESNGPGWATQTHRASAGIAVVTVDDALKSVPGGVLFQVKVDIEGFEKDLFATNTGWLDGVEAVHIEPHEWFLPGERTSLSFQKALCQRDFALLIRGENLTFVASRAADD
ncbi:MAG: hypothetical protein RIS94_2465 [Pseudomonadota bacterium]|jgi:FkbM family methyltransferase